jgi:hypothetical protein
MVFTPTITQKSIASNGNYIKYNGIDFKERQGFIYFAKIRIVPPPVFDWKICFLRP